MERSNGQLDRSPAARADRSGLAGFPRPLNSFEKELLLWLLPEDRAGYNEYRLLLDEWKVIASGRRGEGNYIVGPHGEEADLEIPLPQVLAYGIVETERTDVSVTLRERIGNQIEFEIVPLRGELTVPIIGERRRWSFSYWRAGDPCPRCGKPVREVTMSSARGETFSLAICSSDKQLWVYDAQTGVNHVIPPTVFFNELMLHKNIRDPHIALDVNNIFLKLTSYSDRDLIHAFRTYNQIRTKIPLESPIQLPPQEDRSFLRRLQEFFGKKEGTS
jgi:hypothetical protein